MSCFILQLEIQIIKVFFKVEYKRLKRLKRLNKT
jgi:hypothetical protein